MLSKTWGPSNPETGQEEGPDRWEAGGGVDRTVSFHVKGPQTRTFSNVDSRTQCTPTDSRPVAPTCTTVPLKRQLPSW